MSLSRLLLSALVLSGAGVSRSAAQCLSSANPIGGSNNLLILEKNSLRIISFYRFNYGNKYYEGSKHSDFNLIRSANYNYAGTLIGYGLADKLTIEAEMGYFFNKTQHYNIVPSYSLKGSGFSNAVVSAKLGLIKNDDRRFFISASLGAKIPFSTEPIVRNGVELPVDVQPTIGAYGMVFQLFAVKEQTLSGVRYILTNRIESNAKNEQDYKPGNSYFTSLFFSKHLMYSWLKGDWTTILQVRNEIRGRDKTGAEWKESSGGTTFYFSPQVNYLLKEKWNVSVILDVPVYHYFNGIQLATRYGVSLNIARDFNLSHSVP